MKLVISIAGNTRNVKQNLSHLESYTGDIRLCVPKKLGSGVGLELKTV